MTEFFHNDNKARSHKKVGECTMLTGPDATTKLIWSHFQMSLYTVFGIAYSMVFITGFFRTIGFNELQIAAYGSIMGFMSFLTIVGAWLVQRIGRYRMPAIVLMLSAVVFCTIAVIVGAFGNGRSFIPFIVLSFMGLSFFGTFVVVPVLLPWLHGLVDKQKWTVFLSTRFVAMDVSAIATTIVVGMFLGGAQEINRFLIVFCIASAIGVLGASCLYKLPDLAVTSATTDAKLYIKEIINAILNKEFRFLIAIALLRSFAYGLIIPFQTLFLLEDLKLSYTTISLLVGIGSVFSMLFHKVWARLQRRLGYYNSLRINLVLSVFDPILWMFATQENHVTIYIAFILFGISGAYGAVNAGFWSSYLSTVFQGANEQQKPIYNSLYFVAYGLSVIIAPMISGVVIQYFNRMPLVIPNVFSTGINGFRLVFFASGLFLIVTAIYALRTKGFQRDSSDSPA